MNFRESDLQIACVRWFRYQYPQQTIFSVPNGGFRHKLTAIYMKAEGALAGVADLFVLHASKGKHGLFIEMKTTKGKQSESQIAFEQKCIREGYEYKVCHSFEEFKQTVDNYFYLTD